MKEYPYDKQQDDSDYINEMVFKKPHFLILIMLPSSFFLFKYKIMSIENTIL